MIPGGIQKLAALALLRFLAERHLNMVPASERALFFAAGFIAGFVATYPVRDGLRDLL